MGLPGQWDHPRMWQAVERVAHACRVNRIPWAILPRDAEHARRCIELGCRMLSVGIDTWVVNLGLQAFKELFAEFFAETLLSS
jgi:2-keto-3-deoxy-L-rhamnonate aldolase RhmA